MQRLNRCEYAAHRAALGLSGGTESAVRRAIAEGRIALDASGRLDPVAADAQWLANSRQRVPNAKSRAAHAAASAAGGAAPAGNELYRARVAREQADAARSALALAKEEARVIEAEPAARAVQTVLRTLRDALLVQGRRIAPKVVNRSDVHSIARVIETENRALLVEVCRRLQADLSARSPAAVAAAGPLLTLEPAAADLADPAP
ncbi:MAG: hypothetical protein RL722_525 [Pseudomonadota bacterium]|jgi:hypothetical protein